MPIYFEYVIKKQINVANYAKYHQNTTLSNIYTKIFNK